MFLSLLGFLIGAGAAHSVEMPFDLGPAPVTVDLRNMLREYVVRRSCQALDETAARRARAFDSGDWQPWRDGVREKLRGTLDLPAEWPALNVRAVSKHSLKRGGTLENVLFESLPGWDVNASVFLPNPNEFAPPWQAVVIPVGHSGKQMPSYQIPAQAFARLGYAAVLFDPPGMSGEKTEGNDHFNDGARCLLAGRSSNGYFVADALRCLDYLETRPDIDMSRGAAMTGVSGGGCTTMMATLLDARIVVSGPACTAVPLALHPVRDAYAPCVETLDFGRFLAYDDVDVLAAALPTPLLLMAGAGDEVFKREWSEQIAAEVAAAYEKGGTGGKFRFFLDPGGHDYSLKMVAEFAAWMDKWLAEAPARQLPEWTAADFELLPDDMLKCHPRQAENMFTLTCAKAQSLHGRPFSSMGARDAATILVKPRPRSTSDRVSADGASADGASGGRSLVWFHWLEELTIRPEPGIELPATFLYPAREGWKGGALLYFDDRGRWTDLKKQGFLASATGFIAKETDGPAVLTVDLRGWGDTTPAELPYDIAGWAGSDRWLAYVTAALGDPVFAMRVRDGLAALEYVRSRPAIDGDRVVVGGCGMGGVVALHVAAIDSQLEPAHRPCPVFMNRPLASFELLATSPVNAWPHDDYVPGVLMLYDLPELAGELAAPVMVVNPLGGDAKPLDGDTIDGVYSRAAHLTVHTRLTEDAARAALLEFIKTSTARE
jgi:dienelactone hydrolase